MATSLLLEIDAPSFAALLREVLPAHLVGDIAVHYKQIRALNGHVEAYIERKPDDSFNPRPARVARILIEECRVCDFITVSIALWAGSSALPVADSAEDLALGEALQKIRSPDLKLAEMNLELVAVALSVLLDDVRHLHMSNLSTNRAKELLTRAEVAAESATNLDVSAVIIKKLQHAVGMQRRRRQFVGEDN